MTTTALFNFDVVDASWKECLERGLAQINPDYLQQLSQSQDWLPGHEKIFSAFSLPLSQVNYVLFGESPYPRKESANGYAFWDAAVHELWTPTGLHKRVNRATSLRNIIKMLLIAEGLLDINQPTQEAIANIDKKELVQTNQDLFNNLQKHGILLLNITPVLHSDYPQKDAREWTPFTRELLECLLTKRPQVQFIILGNIAKIVDQLMPSTPGILKLYAEHPYNISFMANQKVLEFFKPLHLLRK